MGKKKGSGKKKKASKVKMTDEERAAAALAEEVAAKEAQQKQAEMASKFLREKLEHEEKYTRLSSKKLDTQWRAILRRAKAEELRKEIAVLSQTFERVMDRKDAVLKSLVRELEEASLQEDRLVQTHVGQIDKLVAMHESVMDQLHGEFGEELQKTQEEFLLERKAILERHERDLANIKDMLFAMNMQHEDYTLQTGNEYDSQRDEVLTKNIEEREQLKQELEQVITDLWEVFQQALLNYKQTTAQKQAEFEKLRADDIKSAAMIERQTRKLNRLSDKVAAMKAQIAHSQREVDDKNRKLKTEKETVLMNFQTLKKRMNRNRTKNRERLVQLTVASRECMDALAARKKRAEAILQLCTRCRALETEEEKVLPFYTETVTQDEIAAVAAEQGGAAPAEAMATTDGTGGELSGTDTSVGPVVVTVDGHPVTEFHMLDNFWKRFNKAYLDKAAAEKDLADLEDENFRLRSLLKQYLDGITVSESVLAQDNTLMVVNGRTNGPIHRVPVGDKRVAAANAGPTIPVQNLALTGVAKAHRAK
mmetsp:Transcript_3584/g.8859  ORF Transcript_3584/g.8859 Transcript_3584/m.8859 type:complete len:536 (-) Transcript_3584:335-1942(-)